MDISKKSPLVHSGSTPNELAHSRGAGSKEHGNSPNQIAKGRKQSGADGKTANEVIASKAKAGNNGTKFSKKL